MEKQNILKEEVLQTAALQKDLKAIKEMLEIQKLKEEIIGYILLENNKKNLGELAGALKKQVVLKINSPGRLPGQGNR